jgi:hypothetical protein
LRRQWLEDRGKGADLRDRARAAGQRRQQAFAERKRQQREARRAAMAERQMSRMLIQEARQVTMSLTELSSHASMKSHLYIHLYVHLYNHLYNIRFSRPRILQSALLREGHLTVKFSQALPCAMLLELHFAIAG